MSLPALSLFTPKIRYHGPSNGQTENPSYHTFICFSLFLRFSSRDRSSISRINGTVEEAVHAPVVGGVRFGREEEPEEEEAGEDGKAVGVNDLASGDGLEAERSSLRRRTRGRYLISHTDIVDRQNQYNITGRQFGKRERLGVRGEKLTRFEFTARRMNLIIFLFLLYNLSARSGDWLGL